MHSQDKSVLEVTMRDGNPSVRFENVVKYNRNFVLEVTMRDGNGGPRLYNHIFSKFVF